MASSIIDLTEISVVCVITFHNKASGTDGMWAVANPADVQDRIADLESMKHIENIQIHHASVK